MYIKLSNVDLIFYSWCYILDTITVFGYGYSKTLAFTSSQSSQAAYIFESQI